MEVLKAIKKKNNWLMTYKRMNNGIQKNSLYEILKKHDINFDGKFLKESGIKDGYKITTQYRKIYRGTNQFIKINGEQTPWKNLPNIRSFEINNKIGYNLILDLYRITSKAYSGEPSSNPEENAEVVITKKESSP